MTFDTTKLDGFNKQQAEARKYSDRWSGVERKAQQSTTPTPQPETKPEGSSRPGTIRPTSEELKKQIADKSRRLEVDKNYQRLATGEGKLRRKEITNLKADLKKAESRERGEARRKAQAERLANKVGKKEVQRLGTGKARILAALKAAGRKGCTNTELSAIQLRYGGSTHELEKDGYDITVTRIEGGLFRYVLDMSKSTAEELL
jgi:hypothetical protein